MDQTRSPSRSLTCKVCLNLIPNHQPSTRWRFNVAENLQIESALPIAFTDLELSSHTCALCSAIKDGIAMMSRSVLGAQLRGLGEGDALVIVQNNIPVEVQVLGEGGNEEGSVRVQFFVKDGRCDPMLTVFGNARDIAPSVSQKSHSLLVQSWITNCLQTHSACRQSSGSVLPTRLLDISPRLDSSVVLVATKNLAVSSNRPLYATLSHCWGIKHFIRTTLSNVHAFMTSIAFDDLPHTFQDAISVVRELGIKYIWIDSLCIIQDSQEDWKHESALMASVYSNSYLNIAATGSSDSSQAFLSSRDMTRKSVSIPTKPLEGHGE